MAKASIKAKSGKQILEYADGRIEMITGKHVAEAAKDGDAEALKIFAIFGHYLGIGLANIVNIFNPEMIVLMGGVASSHRYFLAEAIEVVRRLALMPNSGIVNIVPSVLNQDGAVLGAVALAKEGLKDIKREDGQWHI